MKLTQKKENELFNKAFARILPRVANVDRLQILHEIEDVLESYEL